MLARLPMLALAVLALSLFGCGGTEPEQAVRDYFRAIVERDGEAACAQLSDELRRDIERTPAARRGGRTCADVMALAAGLNPGLKRGDVEGLEIEVEQDGDRAVARLRNPLVRREETLDLVADGDEWKIATLETRPRD